MDAIYKDNMDTVLDQLVNKCYCLTCGDLLDGTVFCDKKIVGLVAKPTYIRLEFCYFPCEREYDHPFANIRPTYCRKTKC